jgi:hypothetical protein
MLSRGSMGRSAVGIALAVTCGTATPALAAAKPGASTGRAANVTQTSATLTGSVDPNSSPTTYSFQIGLTQRYTNATTSGVATGGRSQAVAIPVGGLTPATRYHFRIVARNGQGVARGADRTFKTPRQPLFLSLAASPPFVYPGQSTVLAGTLSGTGNAGRRIVLQANPFPYTQGFANVGDAHVTDAQGAFSFPVLGLGVSTQYRVVVLQPQLASGVVTVGAAVRVGTRVQVRRFRHHGRLRFTGRVRPAHDGIRVVIQKLRDGRWHAVGRTRTHHVKGGDASRYAKVVRVRHGGRFRVLAEAADGDHVPGASVPVKIRARRR